MTANHVPSLMTFTAAAVADRAATILSPAIDPERSTMMISALFPDSAGCASSDISAVTVTTALTRRSPRGRYGLWSMSTVKPGRLAPTAVVHTVPPLHSPDPGIRVGQLCNCTVNVR